MRWRIGISGWGYDNWKEVFYPPKLPTAKRLSYYAEHFDAIEINNTFYSAPDHERIHRWGQNVPGGFLFAVKAPRIITHLKKLKDCEEPMEALLDALKGEKKFGPLIFQLPPNFGKDIARLRQFMKLLPRNRQCSIEFRNPEWHDEEVYGLLRDHNIAFCLFEKAALRSPRVVTADFTYVRLHGRKANYKGSYSDGELREWRDWLAAQKRDAYVFFDNTNEELHAINNAKALQKLVA